MVNRKGAYITNSKCYDEYNIVKWDSLLYTIQEGEAKPGIVIGGVVVNTTKLNPIANAVDWFSIGNIIFYQTWIGTI